MPEYLLVHGCGQVTGRCSENAATLRIINQALNMAEYKEIDPAHFDAVHIADILEARTGHAKRAIPASRALMQQIYNFAADAVVRTRAMEVVASTIDRRTRIVIAHSLGSVAAYEALCLLPDHEVRLFITLGSPLAMPFYVRSRLSAFFAYGRHAWPRALDRWLNFYDYRDPVALWHLGRHFGDGHRIEDRRVYLKSRKPHQLTAYLGSHEVISVLGDGLTKATPAAARKGISS